MSSPSTALEANWLTACRSTVGGMRTMLEEHPTTGDRAVETGRGEGGDEALVIDRAAEELVFAQLDELHARGHRFSAVSEERGVVDYGDARVRVVIDPIDGSMNAKRGLGHHALSVAVADGPTMADVEFAYVYDFGSREEWTARRGQGCLLNGGPLRGLPKERRSADGLLELVAIESADPRHVAAAASALRAVAHRLRALGSIAISLCQVADARVDGMVTLWRCRAVDAAAGQLIVRESGGVVAFTGFADPLGAPLDLEPHSAVVAARSQRALTQLSQVPVP
ncbi:MAG TPA: inositol monophosphatase family protein [Solirubrobacteraceae bacterium]|nr:inositol monophosphatase family protein [Solirubrobacteraceae bacterium]